MTIKERFLKIKAAFDGTPPAPAPAPAPNPPAPSAGKTYKLQDGTEISITQAGDMPATGDMVTINGAPAPAGTLMLTDGSTIVVDATGMITAYTAAAPAPQPAPAPPPPAPPQPVTLAEMTPEQVQDMYAKFAIGTPEERLAGLEIMVKALMECNFGWKIREGNENQAIQVYKDTVATPAAQITAMQSDFAKVEEQAKIIEKHQATITSLLELTGQLVEMPNDDPKTLTGGKKEKFERTLKKENAVLGIAAALKYIKKQN